MGGNGDLSTRLGGSGHQDVNVMPVDPTRVAEPLPALVVGLADNKYFLGRRYAEWCTSAPALESAVAAASMAQDEIGHARSLYPLLSDLTGASFESDPGSRAVFYNAACLNAPFDDWIDFVAVNFAFDTALSVLLEGARDSRDLPLQQRARRMLDEERIHWLHGEGWVRRLAREGQNIRGRLRGAIERVIPSAYSVFDTAHPSLVADRLLTRGTEELAILYRARIDPVLHACHLDEP